jgi:hypothetical protein
MAYTPTVWEDRQVSRPMTFELRDNGDGTHTLISAEGSVITAGTPINSENLNNIETGIVNSVALSDFVNHIGFGTTTNVGNAYAVTLSPAPIAYIDGMAISIKVNADSTGNVTININGLGAKNIVNSDGKAVTNLKLNGLYTMRYNLTTGNFILQGEGGDVAPLITQINAILNS